MTAGERIVQLLGIWVTVYLSVLGVSYLFRWLALDWPLWLELMVSTALTVPVISFIAVPSVKRAIAEAEGTTPAELTRREARAMEDDDGPGETRGR